MRRPAAAFFLIFSLLIAVQAIAGSLEDASEAFDRSDYKTAYRLFKPLAEQGYVQTQCYLGLMYAQGKGVPKNNAEAMKWFRKAAEKGDASGQYALGKMYVRSQDYVEAVKWIRKAAEGGSANAIGKSGATGQRLDRFPDRGTPSVRVSWNPWRKETRDVGKPKEA